MMIYRQIFKLITISFLFIFLTTCNKDDEDTLIKGQLIIRETNQPLKGFLMSFDVANGSGFLGSVERSKYSAVSDDNGYFSFRVLNSEIGKYFWVSDYSAGNHCWPNYDTISSQTKYMLIDNERYILKDKKTKLYYAPRGSVDFWVSHQTFIDLKLDTIIVKSKYDSDTIINRNKTLGDGHRNKRLYVEPSKVHKFEYMALKNGTIYNQITKDIYIMHECSQRLGEPDGFKEVKF